MLMRRRAWLAAAVLAALASCSPQQPATQAGSRAVVAAPVEAPPAVTPAQVAPAQVTPALAADQPPPTVNGLYLAKDVCPGEGCYLSGKIKAYEAVGLFDKAGPGAAIIGQVGKGEWVDILDREEYVVPTRGVVVEGRGQFATGDVVYLLTSEGEGCYDVWSKGAHASWCDPDASADPASADIVNFAPPPDEPVEGSGLWVKVKRAQGGEGWLKDVSGLFACTGYQDRDADCPPLPQ